MKMHIRKYLIFKEQDLFPIPNFEMLHIFHWLQFPAPAFCTLIRGSRIHHNHSQWCIQVRIRRNRHSRSRHLRLTLTTAMVAFTPDTVTAVWATAMAVLATDTASVPRTPMPTTAMAVTADTDLDTPLAMVMVDTATSDKSAKGWCRELQPMKRCSISKLGIRNKPCFLEIGYFLMCIFMDKKQNVIKNEK